MNDNRVLQDDDRRVCQRINLNRRMRIELASGESIEGQSEDISLGGVLLKSDVPVDSHWLDRSASLYFSVSGQFDQRAYPCRITRVVENSVGLELAKDVMAEFGKALTRGMFVRKRAL